MNQSTSVPVLMEVMHLHYVFKLLYFLQLMLPYTIYTSTTLGTSRPGWPSHCFLRLLRVSDWFVAGCQQLSEAAQAAAHECVI